MERRPRESVRTQRHQKIDKHSVSRRATNIEAKAPRRKKHKTLPMLIGGSFVFFATVLILGLIWSIIAYFTKINVADSTAAPLGIFLAAIFIASFFLAFLLDGRHLMPILMFIILTSAIALLIAGFKDFSLSGLIIKTTASLICGFIANVILIRLRPGKNRIKKYVA